ncbi:MAG: cytochrome c3 family protein [Terriglobales bacterium]
MRNFGVLMEKLRSGRTAVASFALCFVVGLFVWGAKKPVQPIAFNHKKHIENGVGCTDCHSGAQEQARATLPELSTCMTCHESALGQSPEEAKVRAAAAAGRELVWTQLTRVPTHVYFSHRRHVQEGKVECAVCHGEMQKRSVPPTARFRPLDMNDCINCHIQRGVYTDCNDCHR